MKKQPNQLTYRDAIQSARKKADARKAEIQAEIDKLEAEIAMRRFALEQIDELIATLEKQTGNSLQEHRPTKIQSSRIPVRPPLSAGVAKLARKRHGKKKAKK